MIYDDEDTCPCCGEDAGGFNACPDCGGDGRDGDEDCAACDGTGDCPECG